MGKSLYVSLSKDSLRHLGSVRDKILFLTQTFAPGGYHVKCVPCTVIQRSLTAYVMNECSVRSTSTHYPPNLPSYQDSTQLRF